MGAHMTISFDTTGLETYVTDKDREASTGIWFKFPEGRRFLCLRAGGSNRKFLRAFQTAIKPYRRQMDRGTMDPDKSDEIMREVYARTVILDWDGIKDSAGQAVPFSTPNVVEFMSAFPELFNDLVTLCSDAAQFSEEALEEAKEILGEA